MLGGDRRPLLRRRVDCKRPCNNPKKSNNAHYQLCGRIVSPLPFASVCLQKPVAKWCALLACRLCPVRLYLNHMFGACVRCTRKLYSAYRMKGKGCKQLVALSIHCLYSKSWSRVMSITWGMLHSVEEGKFEDCKFSGFSASSAALVDLMTSCNPQHVHMRYSIAIHYSRKLKLKRAMFWCTAHKLYTVVHSIFQIVQRKLHFNSSTVCRRTGGECALCPP
jgi:hypothetical protein